MHGRERVGVLFPEYPDQRRQLPYLIHILSQVRAEGMHGPECVRVLFFKAWFQRGENCLAKSRLR